MNCKYINVYKKVYQMNSFNKVVNIDNLLEILNIDLNIVNNEIFQEIKKDFSDNENIIYTNDGFSYMDKNNKCIILNDINNKKRMNFTLFHEIGHFVLKHFSENIDLNDNIKEIEANIFARNMLIPHLKYKYLYNDKTFSEYINNNVSRSVLRIKKFFYNTDNFYVNSILDMKK